MGTKRKRPLQQREEEDCFPPESNGHDDVDRLMADLAATLDDCPHPISEHLSPFQGFDLYLFEEIEDDNMGFVHSDVNSSKDNPIAPYPKGYVSAFNFFVMHRRLDILSNNPHLNRNNNLLNKMLGDTWKTLSPKERGLYEEQADRDKQRYLLEVQAYNKTAEVKVIPRINPPPSMAEKIGERPIKRPLTAYSIFAQQERQFVSNLKCKNIKRAMSKYFGMRWKQMSKEEKSLYIALEVAHRDAAVKPPR